MEWGRRSPTPRRRKETGAYLPRGIRCGGNSVPVLGASFSVRSRAARPCSSRGCWDVRGGAGRRSGRLREGAPAARQSPTMWPWRGGGSGERPPGVSPSGRRSAGPPRLQKPPPAPELRVPRGGRGGGRPVAAEQLPRSARPAGMRTAGPGRRRLSAALGERLGSFFARPCLLFYFVCVCCLFFERGGGGGWAGAATVGRVGSCSELWRIGECRRQAGSPLIGSGAERGFCASKKHPAFYS